MASQSTPKKKKKKKKAAAAAAVGEPIVQRRAEPIAGEEPEDKRFSMIVLTVVSLIGIASVIAWGVVRYGGSEERSERDETEQVADEEEDGDPLAAPSDVSAPPANAERTASGLATRVLRPGTGTEHPEESDRVVVHYTGWRAENGERFDSSVARGEPATFPVAGVVPGFAEGLKLMVVGEKRRLWIPEDLAYRGRPGAPAGMLVFDVELIRIE